MLACNVSCAQSSTWLDRATRYHDHQIQDCPPDAIVTVECARGLTLHAARIPYSYWRGVEQPGSSSGS